VFRVVELMGPFSYTRVRERLAKLDAALANGSPISDDWSPANRRPIVQPQRRLDETEIKSLRQGYLDGRSIDNLARSHRINRTTVIAHLECGGIERRKVVRKMTDASVLDAARQYAAGASLFNVARKFGVNDRTLRREFERAQVPTRPRLGSA